MTKPRLFIGFSKEGLALASALHSNLQHALEVTVWHQGVFGASTPGLTALLANLDTQDFGAFISSPDDVLSIRGTSANVVRDNVIFELGRPDCGRGLLARDDGRQKTYRCKKRE